jgi:hypothetical protein
VEPEPHFLRTSDGYEIDLLLKLGGVTAALEIKLAASAIERLRSLGRARR